MKDDNIILVRVLEQIRKVAQEKSWFTEQSKELSQELGYSTSQIGAAFKNLRIKFLPDIIVEKLNNRNWVIRRR